MGQSAQRPNFTPFGTVFQPIGFINGKPVWPVLGGAPEDGDGSSGAGDDGNAGDGKQDGDGDPAGDGNDGSGDGSESLNDGSGEKTYTQAEWDALQNRMKAADRRASTAENKVTEFERANQTELERYKAENEELKKRDGERETEFQTLRLRDAFRDASGEAEIVWHNPGLALDQLNRDLITEEDGKIKGMAAAIKALAKDHPYLVKDKETTGGGRASGSPTNGKPSGGTTTDRDKLAAKFPALRGRGGN